MDICGVVQWHPQEPKCLQAQVVFYLWWLPSLTVYAIFYDRLWNLDQRFWDNSYEPFICCIGFSLLFSSSRERTLIALLLCKTTKCHRCVLIERSYFPIFLFKKSELRIVQLRNVWLYNRSTAISVECCLSFFLKAKRKVSMRMAPIRKAYSNEKKTEVILWHYQNWKIGSKIVKKLSIDHEQVWSYFKYEESIL